jgi:hypothetical protein
MHTTFLFGKISVICGFVKVAKSVVMRIVDYE